MLWNNYKLEKNPTVQQGLESGTFWSLGCDLNTVLHVGTSDLTIMIFQLQPFH